MLYERAKKIIICMIVLMSMLLISTIVSEAGTNTKYTLGNAPIQFDEVSKDMFPDGSSWASYEYKGQICVKSTYSNGLSQYQDYYTLYSTSPIAFYQESGEYYAYSANGFKGYYNDCYFFDSTALTSENYLQVYNTELAYGSIYCISSMHNTNQGYSHTIHLNTLPVFDSMEHAKAYCESGATDGLIQDIYSDELIEDTTQGFKQFQVRRLFDSSIGGGTGALVTYELPTGTFDALNEKRICYELTYSYCMVRSSGYLSNKLDDAYFEEYKTKTFIVYDELTSDYGQRVFDFVSLCKESGCSEDDCAFLVLCMSNYCEDAGVFFEWGSSFLGGIIGAPEDFFDTDLYYKVNNMEVNVKAYVTDGVNKSKTSSGYVDLITGQNQSMAIQGDKVEEDGSVTEGDVVEEENVKDAMKQLNSDGTISYIDVNVNVDVGGGSSGGDITQNNEVNIPSHIDVTIKDSTDDDITIEDDDYSADALHSLVDSGFGFFDDLDTEQNDDGFMSYLTAFFMAINPDLAGALGFGMGATIMISVIRSIFKR